MKILCFTGFMANTVLWFLSAACIYLSQHFLANTQDEEVVEKIKTCGFEGTYNGVSAEDVPGMAHSKAVGAYVLIAAASFIYGLFIFRVDVTPGWNIAKAVVLILLLAAIAEMIMVGIGQHMSVVLSDVKGDKDKVVYASSLSLFLQTVISRSMQIEMSLLVISFCILILY